MTASDEEKIKAALKLLFERDKYLLANNSSERSIAFRFALYLCSQFEEYDVDCEYNYHHKGPKRIFVLNKEDKKYFRIRKTISDVNAHSVYPDIIIHKRGTDVNLLIIEIKKSTNKDEYDKQRDSIKIREYSKQIGYTFSTYLEIPTGKDYDQYFLDKVKMKCIKSTI